MKNNLFVIRVIAYSLIFFGVWGCLTLFPPKGDYMWEPLPTGVLTVINLLTAILFTLFVGLTARLARTNRTVLGILLTAVFILFFCPGEEVFFDRDEAALTELASQCIAPFFISQYMRVSHKDFHRWYLLMFLMGIFCSYTHNGITIPLCCSFVWLAFQRHDRFFRLACWPMVIGVIIGTGLSIYQRWDDSLTMETDFQGISSVTSIALKTLWDTKVFVITLVLSAYLLSLKNGRKRLTHIIRRHYVISLCTFMSLLTLPFAPLGIENAVTGVCFFSMLWLLFLCQYLVAEYLNRKI